MSTTWSDVSQHQGIPIDDSYPYEFFCFRTNTGSVRDTLAVENAKRAKAMLDAGKLAGVFPYYFFRPGAANCDLHRTILQEAGLWGHAKTASMVDVESGNGSAQGSIANRDHSAEINDEINRMRGWYGNTKRVFGYLNAVADPHLWRSPPSDLPFVTPSYSHKPGVWASTAPPAWMQQRAFAQQYTDRAITKPWPNGTDANYSTRSVAEIATLLGLTGGAMSTVESGAKQLSDKFGNVRRPVDAEHLKYLPSSFADDDGPWPNDMWAALVNEIVWDGYTIPAAMADLPDDKQRTLVALIQTIAARQGRLEAKIDELIKLATGGEAGDD